MLRWLLLPWWLVSLATTAKNFRDHPLIGSHWLNRAGLHVWRVWLAQVSMQWRQACLRGMMPRSLRERFARDGYVVIPDFLDPELFRSVREEARHHEAPRWQCRQGDTLTQRILLDAQAIRRHPALGRLTRSRRLQHLLRYASGRNTAPLLYIQRIRNGAVPGQGDPQKRLHVDTFHPTMKAWLFLHDVTAEQGPFTFVPGSHRVTGRMRRWLQWRSIHARELRDHYSAKGSWRISPAERRWLRLPEPQAVAVTANTLVIANTMGMHRRGACEGAHDRLEIWAYARGNPFWPIPGLGWDGLEPLVHRGIQAVLTWRAQRAERQGRQAAWIEVPAEGASRPI